MQTISLSNKRLTYVKINDTQVLFAMDEVLNFSPSADNQYDVSSILPGLYIVMIERRGVKQMAGRLLTN